IETRDYSDGRRLVNRKREPPMSASTICHGCGRRLEVPAEYARSKMRCPDCGVMCEVPPPESRRLPVKQAARQSAPRPERPPTKPPVKVDDLPVPLAPEPAPPPREPEFDFSDDPDDGKPYGVTGEIYKKCPQCSRRLEPKTTQCPGCGCDL